MTDEAIKQMFSDRVRVPKDETHRCSPPSPETYEKMRKTADAASKMDIKIQFLCATPINESPTEIVDLLLLTEKK